MPVRGAQTPWASSHVLDKRVTCRGSDPQGRAGYFELLYGGGTRDSELTLKADLAACLKT